MKPKASISVVTISFNQAKYISECLESVLSQDVNFLEYIVIDAGSTDGSVDLITSREHEIDCIIIEPDEGPASGLNKGFARATGDIFAYINADDKLMPGAIRKVLNYFDRHPDVDVIIGHGFELNAEGERVRRIFSTRWNLDTYVSGIANAVQQATFFRRDAFIRAGGFNESNRTCWDTELLVDMILCGANLQLVNDFFGSFRVYSESITGSGKYHVLALEDRDRIIKKICKNHSFGRGRRWYYGFLTKHLMHPFQAAYKVQWLIRRFFLRSISFFLGRR